MLSCRHAQRSLHLPLRAVSSHSAINATSVYRAQFHTYLRMNLAEPGARQFEKGGEKVHGQKRLKSGPPPREKKLSPSIVRKILHLTPDRLKITDEIKNLLAKDRVEDALILVRESCKQGQVIVAWNQIIDWYLKKSHLKDAWSIYNEMKKRKQVPSSHTYSILLRGLANHADKSTKTMERTLKIRDALFKRGNLTPVEVNSLLTVCNKAGDVETMFSVIAELPESGEGAPDVIAYTLILDTMRVKLEKDIEAATGTENANETIKMFKAEKLEATQKIYEEMLSRFSARDLRVDEKLMLAVCRMLAAIRHRSWLDDIFAILNQLADVPQLLPQRGTTKRENLGLEQMPDEKDSVQTSPNVEHSTDTPATKFPPVLERRPYRIMPTDPTFTVILQLLSNPKLKQYASQYWEVFTKDWGREPDQWTVASYLRLLRITRSSTEAVRVLEDVADRRKGFSELACSLAMATVARDNHNPSAFANAQKIIQLLGAATEKPDPTILSRFLRLARVTPVLPQFEAQGTDSSEKNSRFARGRQILHAIKTVDEFERYMKAELLLARQIEMKHWRLLDVFQQIDGAYHYLIKEEMVNREDHRPLIDRRRKISAYVYNTTQTMKEKWVKQGNVETPKITIKDDDEPEISLGRSKDRFQDRSRGGYKGYKDGSKGGTHGPRGSKGFSGSRNKLTELFERGDPDAGFV